MFSAARSSVSLPCAHVGSPPPIAARWFADGKEMIGRREEGEEDSSLSSALRIDSVTREDEGNYTCFVENQHGSDSVAYNLFVQGKITMDNGQGQVYLCAHIASFPRMEENIVAKRQWPFWPFSPSVPPPPLLLFPLPRLPHTAPIRQFPDKTFSPPPFPILPPSSSDRSTVHYWPFSLSFRGVTGDAHIIA